MPELLHDLPPDSDVVADRGYDSNATLELIRQARSRAHIPTPCRRLIQRSVDPTIYRQRNLIERFFNKLKHFRRIATRYDKLARNFLAAVLLASTSLSRYNALSGAGHDMRRRAFITLLGGAAASWPLAARAQQSEPMRRIGVLMNVAADHPLGQAGVAAFQKALLQLGWSDGGNVRIDIR